MNLKSFIISVFTVSAVCLPAFAEKDPDEYRVQVFLENGDTVTGYIRNDLTTGLKNMFSKTGPIRQYVNVGMEPKGGETRRFKASEIKAYRFTEPTEAYPEGAVCVSDMLNSPGMFRPGRCVRGLAWELDRRESGSVLRWDVWVSTGGRNNVSRLVPAVGIKLKGSNAAYVVMADGLFNDMFFRVYLRKYPELKKAWEEYYFDCKDAKAHRKELTDNPSTALTFYEEYLRSNPPIDDSAKGKKK